MALAQCPICGGHPYCCHCVMDAPELDSVAKLPRVSMRKRVWGSRVILALVPFGIFYGLSQLHNSDRTTWEPFGHVSNVAETILYIAGYVAMGIIAVCLAGVICFYGIGTILWIIHTLCVNAFGDPDDAVSLTDWWP